MINIFDVAAYIIKQLGKVTIVKLQILTYYCQAWSLTWDDKPLFEEDFEAWANGPVVPNVYYYYCGYGAMPIASLPEGCNFTPVERDMVDSLIENKRVLQPWDLVADAHKQNGAWHLVYENGDHKIIPASLIKTYG